jgi:Protein of unknown function (DUF3592)
MAGIFMFDSIRRSLRESARKKRVQAATAWPQARAEINSWKILPVGEEAESFTQSDYIEAGFSFVLKGEYYGGYLRSVAMGRKEAENFAVGSLAVNVRYNPANPDQVVVLAEDNPTLSFALVSG